MRKQAQETSARDDDTVRDATLDAVVEAVNATSLGEKVRWVEEKIDRFSGVGIVGTGEGASVYHGKGSDAPEKEYEISLSARIQDYRPVPSLMVEYKGLDFEADYTDVIGSRLSYKPLNKFVPGEMSLRSEYASDKASLALEFEFSF
ncbi:MAG: hypothetical protein ACQESG_00255 [Nanobdellota archaeon]